MTNLPVTFRSVAVVFAFGKPASVPLDGLPGLDTKEEDNESAE